LFTDKTFQPAPIILEVCAASLASGIAAQQGGADRIELCANLNEGGTTPSPGTIQSVRKFCTIEIYPIIRPRGGDFLYDEGELEVMTRDILFCKNAGCDGIVMGILHADGQVDKDQVSRLVELAWPMGVTFHRAFDMTADPNQALTDILDTGCERILTSGQQPTALEGAPLIADLIRQAAGRIIIMPGSGIREHNIAALVRETGATEFHTSARITLAGRMNFKNPLIALGNDGKEYELSVTDARQVGLIRTAAETALNTKG